MPDLTYTPWSFHPTLAISWLLMPQKLGNAEAQIIFYDNFTLFSGQILTMEGGCSMGKFSLIVIDS